MKNNNDNNNKVNRKMKQINRVKSFKKTISKNVPLSPVTIDIVGQHLKKKHLNLTQKKSHFMLIQSIRLESIQLMLPKRFSFSKFFYIIGLVN